MAALALNAILAVQAPFLVLLLQLALLGLGAAGFAVQGRWRNLGALNRPNYSLLTSFSSLVAIVRFVKGERMDTWKPVREERVTPA
jgi:hypothetical protein